MTLDIIIATHNRAAQLCRLLDSIRAATRPEALGVRVLVVDNMSRDNTREVVEHVEPIAGGRPLYLHETQLGKANAVNAGLRHIEGDLVALLDDDEQIDAGWLETVYDVFSDESVDFISGPYKPDWGAPPPSWLPTQSYPAVIGWIEAGDSVRRYGTELDGIMMGGNAVMRRSVVERVGLFNPALGRRGTRLLAGEDAEYHERMLAAGARGYYVPRLAIYHHIPPERLTKRYHRSWCFYRGVSLGYLERTRPQPVAHVLGVPRHLVGHAVRSIPRLLRALWRRNPEAAFTSELAWWDVAGFAYGRHLARE